MDDNPNKETTPAIKGIIKKKFDAYFWKCYQEFKKATFKIINTYAKDEIGITNPTFKNGLGFLKKEGFIEYKKARRQRDTEITLTDKYIKELRKVYGEGQNSATEFIAQNLDNENITLENSAQEIADEEDIETSITPILGTSPKKELDDLHVQKEELIQSKVQSALSTDDYSEIISFITPLIKKELEARRKEDIKVISELRTEVKVLKSMINSLEMAKRSQDLAMNVIKDQMMILEEKISKR